MKSIQQQRLEFLNDTVDYYAEDTSRRAVTIDNAGHKKCEYLTEDGRRCAIGRHLYLNLEQSKGLSHYSVSKFVIFYSLPEEVKLLGKEFLLQIQRIHDWDCYWDDKGLSEEGKHRVEFIKSIYCE